jgi:hypothetical protein
MNIANGAHVQDRTREKWHEVKEAERLELDAKKEWARRKRVTLEKRAEFDRYLGSDAEDLHPLYDLADAPPPAQAPRDRPLPVSVDGGPAGEGGAEVRLPVAPVLVPASEVDKPDSVKKTTWRDRPVADLELPPAKLKKVAAEFKTVGELADFFDRNRAAPETMAKLTDVRAAVDRLRAPAGPACATCGSPTAGTVCHGKDPRGQCRGCFERAHAPEEAPVVFLFPAGWQGDWPAGVLASQALKARVETVGDALKLDPEWPPKGLSAEQCGELLDAARRWLVARQGNSSKCRVCGCTSEDCSGCIERTGAPCSWADDTKTLCTACLGIVNAELTTLPGLSADVVKLIEASPYRHVRDALEKPDDQLVKEFSASVNARAALKEAMRAWVESQLHPTGPATKPKPKKGRSGLPAVTPEAAAFVHEHLCPKGPQKPLPEGLPLAAGPVAGRCPNCGVKVDDDAASGPDARCDVCRLKARRPSAGAKGAKP